MSKNSHTFYVFTFFILSNLIHAQEVLLEFNTDYDAGPALIDNSFTLVNEATDDFTVFLTNNSNLSAFNYSNSYEFKGWLASRKLPNKYKVPLGGTVNKQKYSLFYANENNSKFAVVTFDFEKNWSFASEIDLDLKKEVYLSQFIYKNKFHLLTSSYRESVLYMYSFTNSGEYVKESIDIDHYEFYGPEQYPTRLKSTLGLDIQNNELTKITAVQEGIPYSLDSMVSLIKLYIIEDSFYLVSDINSDFTQIIAHDLRNGTTKADFINHASLERALTNSYLTGNKLFQIAVNSKNMSVRITDLLTKEIYKQHDIAKTDSLYLANGPIRQRGGRYTAYRELEKTAQFLRKLGNGKPAIYVNENSNQFEITIGSVDEISNDLITAIAYLNPVSAVASFGALTLYANPVALAMIKASNSKAVYINNILDSNFEPINQEEKENIFFVINDYIEKEDLKRITASDVFKYKNFYVFGVLDKKTKTYTLRKFVP